MELNDAQKQLKTHTRIFRIETVKNKNLLQMGKTHKRCALVTDNVLFHIFFPQIFFCAHIYLIKVNSAQKFVRFSHLK